MADRFWCAHDLPGRARRCFNHGLDRLRPSPISLGGLVAARFLQGLGGSMMVPIVRLVVLVRGTPKHDSWASLAFLTVRRWWAR